MNHFTILGCGYNIISMLMEILSNQYNDKVVIDIVKNIRQDKPGQPYRISHIESREVDADNWEKKDGTKYLFGIADPTTKKVVHEYFLERFSIHNEHFATLIHGHTSVASTAIINRGVVINPGVVVAPFATVERFAFINRNVSLGHHTSIGESSLINPGVNIAGFCTIGKNVVIGMGANIIDRIKIGDHTIIGAGSLVNKDIPDNVLAYGNPAKVVRELSQGKD